MSRYRRIGAALFLTLICAPGTLLRSDVSWNPPETITLTPVSGKSDSGVPGWEVAGVWELSGKGLLFGGYSALVAFPDGQLRAFSDRGARFTFAEPGREGTERKVVRQRLAPDRTLDLADIESAAIDPRTGTYWLAFENDHAIDRFAADHTPERSRDMDPAADALSWSNNSGAEAFTRLSDGRFILLPEGKRVGLIFDQDPAAGEPYETFAYLPPVPGHGATDMVQLPDGRVLLLLRNLDPMGGIPPFESKIALGPMPSAQDGDVWAPQVTLDLAGVIPRENYEGIAVRPLKDGRVAVWLIADDNLSMMQRTLVVKLLLDPAKLAKTPGKAKGAQE